jgi:hypothetical protein
MIPYLVYYAPVLSGGEGRKGQGNSEDLIGSYGMVK